MLALSLWLFFKNHIRSLWHPKWNKTGQCPCTNPFLIFFAVMLKHTFGTAAECVYLWTRSDGNLSNLSSLRAKTKLELKWMQEFLFTDAAVVARSGEDLQQHMNCFSKACQDFGLTTSLKTTQVMDQCLDSYPSITISTQELCCSWLVYLGSMRDSKYAKQEEIDLQ